MPKLVLGVDGGGTKTVCLLVDESRTVRGRGQAGPSNRYAVGDTAAEAALGQAMSAALSDGGARPEDISAICLGMAGVDRPGDAPVVETMVRRLLPVRARRRLPTRPHSQRCGHRPGRRRGPALWRGDHRRHRRHRLRRQRER